MRVRCVDKGFADAIRDPWAVLQAGRSRFDNADASAVVRAPEILIERLAAEIVRQLDLKIRKTKR
jgi:hypothetical protein